MTTSALPAGRESAAITIDYQLDGPRNAIAVVRGESRLIGVALAGGGIEPTFVTEDVPSTMQNMGGRPRVYDDAILGLVIERVFGLPSCEEIDDVSVMRELLTHAGLHQSTDEIQPSNPLARVAAIREQFGSLPPQLLATELGNTYAQIEIRLIDAVADMIVHGLGIDQEILRSIESSAAAELEILRHQLSETAGMEIDPDNDDQVRRFLYDRCGLPVPPWTPRGQLPSVNKDALRMLAGQHAAIPLLQRYREEKPVLQAARSLVADINPRTGRIHGLLAPTRAVTGRFGCRDSNLQGMHHRLKPVMIASPGHVLIEADVSQAEFRVLAHFSQEPTLLEAFRLGNVDLHRQTMALVLGKSVDEITDGERQIGKAVNFGIIYGQTEHGLSRKLGVTEREARRFIEGFFRARPAVRQWIATIHDQVRQTGFVQTLCGRRRALPAIWSTNPAEVHAAERRAVNTIIQGTAADLIKLAIIRVHQNLPSRLLLTIHDSVLVEAPAARTTEVATMLKREMEIAPPRFSVPIVVDVEMGTTWS